VLNRLFARSKSPPGRSTDGRLIYAVGDIHGRLDLLTDLMARLTRDAADTRPDRPPVLIFVGDYVDRGPDSRGVLNLVRRMIEDAQWEVRALLGNHEEVMLNFLEDASVGASWVEFGGAQTLAQYGIAPPAQRGDAEGWAAAQAAFTASAPAEEVAFLRRLELSATYGDYMFVHAGVRPGVALDRQVRADLLWIREAFLNEERPFRKIVVHGHTPEVKPHAGPVRIGIDTGAYATGVLTAVRLWRGEATFLQASAHDPRL
jgi:serine/threonine protein phosphatase 1